MAQYDRDGYSSSHSGSHGRGGGGYRGRGDGGFRARGRGGFRPRSGLGFKKSYSDEVREEVEELYGKKFRFKDEFEQWTLPPAETMFREEPFEVSKLLKLKEQLNTTKAKLNDKEMISWHKHTNFTNRAGIVIPAVRRDYNPEMCTQGWVKFHEILWQYGSLVPESTTKLHSVHLCEAPGGFVASMNHFLKTHRMDCEWKWRAMTLNPYFEGMGVTYVYNVHVCYYIEASKVKQTTRQAHPRQSLFIRKMSCLGWDSNSMWHQRACNLIYSTVSIWLSSGAV